MVASTQKGPLTRVMLSSVSGRSKSTSSFAGSSVGNRFEGDVRNDAADLFTLRVLPALVLEARPRVPDPTP